jgi:hypothetical protein
MSITTLETLSDTSQDAVIDWYEMLTQSLEPYGIQLTPFDDIEMMYGPYAFCIPGIGVEKYSETGRALAQVLTTKLLPMKTNANDESELSQLLEMAVANSRPNGFQLLEIVMKQCVKIFDSNEVELEWPKYSNYNNVFQYGKKMLQTAKLAAKKGQVYSERTVAITFLNSIYREAGDIFRFAALMKKNEIESYPPRVQLPAKFQLMQMAKEISDAKPSKAKPKEHSIYKTTATPIQPSQATQTIEIDKDSYVNPQSGTHLNGLLQGATRETYFINNMYRPSKNFKPKRKPVPDPAKEQAPRKSLFDATIICNACHMIGHPACRCHTLAAAVYVFKYLEDKANEEECKKALEYWDERNRAKLRDPKTSKVCEMSPMQVLRTYIDRYGHSLETIDADIDWKYFERENSCDRDFLDAFGMDWRSHEDQHSE